MEKYDVIIVGAGPGGLQCAEVLSRSNKKVLLLEKNKIIGPKVCAGGLTRKAISFLQLSDDIIGNRFESIVFRKEDKQTRLMFGEDFVYTVDRKELGQWQLNKIKNSNIVIRTETRVTKVSKNYIVINDTEKIYFDFLVGADGSNSIVRKYLKLKTKYIGVALQYILPKDEIKSEDIQIFFNSKLFSAWYAWIFPHKKYVSIGCGYFSKVMNAKTAVRNFETWMKKIK